jgi:tRNA-uridine 2-sulfurtransferase
MGGTLAAVAMSGGVDSSVAAALLAREGRALVGLSMYLARRHELALDGKARCCSLDDCQDAKKVAGLLGFPHRVLDMEDDFRRLVVDPFTAEYARGRTPSPCIGCNSLVKFGTLLEKARDLGATTVATGHYAILERDPETGRTLLRKAVDEGKDQSYFLFDLSEEQRRAAEFPLGRMKKDDVREVARSLGLVTAEKPESMDLCFLNEGETYRDFLARRGVAADSQPGEIVDVEGHALARHDGIAGFTVGQRRGLGIAAGRPLYVVRIEEETRRVVVGGDEDLRNDRCTIVGVRWIPFERPSGPLRATVKIRSTHPGAAATIEDRGDGTASVLFDEPQRAIAPGQAAVAYDGDLVLGGGWIRV